MTSTTLEALVLKTDNLGRVRTPPQRREALLDEFEKSEISGMKFARAIGVKYQTFAWWVQQRRRQRDKSPKVGESSQGATKLRWVEAVLEEKAGNVAAGALRVQLPGGAHLEVIDRGQVLLAAELLRALLSKEARLSCRALRGA